MVHPIRTFRLLPIALLGATLLVSACKQGPLQTNEYVYVSGQQVALRDRVATVYNKVGTAKNGERLEVLERQKRFVRVRTPRGEEGWVEQRNLADPDVYEGFQKLANDSKKSPVQGKGKTRSELNMHLKPARDGETLYQLAEAAPVEILARATSERLSQAEIQAKQLAEARDAALDRQIEEAQRRREREAAKKKKDAMAIPQPTVAPPKGWDQKTPPELLAPPKSAKGKGPAKPEQPRAYDDWWLVRNPQGQVGWVLARMVDLDIPLEIATYFEGQRPMGAWQLNTVHDEGKDVPQYLVVLNDNRDGTPWDFNQIRVFTWNTKRHRYETAYRERNIVGFFPVKVGSEEFGKEGQEPTFLIRKQNEDGSITERKYRMIGPIVREVKSEGEQPKAAKATKAKPEPKAKSKRRK